MKRNYYYLIMVLGLAASLSSCKDYLDVHPEDKLLDDQVYSSATNIKSYLNGMYVRLGGANLYGENLTLSIPDILAQSYNVPSTHTLASYASYTYTGTPAAKLAETWNTAYATIFNVNQFIAGIEASSGVLDAKTDSIYHGEALAIRALLHFDILRLYGPKYNTVDSTSTTPELGIPYNASSKVVVHDLLPANVVMNKIMADLSRAERLLSTDMSMNTDRKYKFTYYSVKALQARINMYRGNKVAALACAMVLINNANKFPWVTASSITDKANPDKIFSSEMILGAYNTDLYKTGSGYLKFFSGDLADASILAPNDARLSALFAGDGATDFRFSAQIWDLPPSKSYKIFLKYADILDKTKSYRNTIPLLKLSEMYYIAAECEAAAGNMTIANNYLNTVRLNRGINTTAFPVTASQAEIQREYQKEFFGEGQLWYYYKRTNTAKILNGATSTNTANDLITPAYVVPKPTSEMTNR